jgi:membrane-associated protease RseP (regulator of RpoE activity)
LVWNGLVEDAALHLSALPSSEETEYMVTRVVAAIVFVAVFASSTVFAQENVVIEELNTPPPAVRPKFILGLTNLTNVRATIGRKRYYGVRIGGVVPRSAAYRNRLEKNDVIIEIDGEKTKTWVDVTTAINGSNGTINLKVINCRNSRITKIENVELQEED